MTVTKKAINLRGVSRPSRTSKMKFIKKIFIFTICSILDIWTESEYTFAFDTLESKQLFILSRSDKNLKSKLTF